MLFGYVNLYNTILYCFLTVVKLIAVSALSNALLGRRRWDFLVVIYNRDLLFNGNGNKIEKWIYFYCFRAVENYKDAFQLIYITKMERFNSRLYFYYIDNGIDLLTVAVDLSRVPPIIVEG